MQNNPSQTVIHSKKILISPVIPPSKTGQGIIIDRLLSNKPTDWCLVATKPCEQPCSSDVPEKIFLGQTPKKPKNTLLRKLYQLSNIMINFYKLILLLNQLVKRYPKCQIIACTGDIIILPACWFVSKLQKKHLTLYIFDDFINQWSTPPIQFIARIIEKQAAKQSDKILVTNEFLADIYRKRYHKPCHIIRNLLAKEMTIASVRPKQHKTNMNILYTGSIYHAHYDAFQNLIDTLEDFPHITLHIFTSQHPDALKQHLTLTSQVIFNTYQSSTDIELSLKEADFLFLPLSFNENYHKLIHTSAPGKLAEYLASGTPILVHAPKNCFLSWYTKKHECAYVVDTPDKAALKQALIQLTAQDNSTFIENALESAQKEFSHEVVSLKLEQLLS